MTELEFYEYVGASGGDSTLDKVSDFGNYVGGLLIVGGLVLFFLR